MNERMKMKCFFLVMQSANFILYKNKRLNTTTMKTLEIDLPRLCVNHCLATNGCLAVNLLSDLKTSCELTSGHVTMNDLADQNNSDVYVVGVLCIYFLNILNPSLLKIFLALLVAR